jgi:NAD+ kinase
MKTVGVIANCRKAMAPAVLQRLHRKAIALGMSVLADEPTARLMEADSVAAFPELAHRSDVLMVLGGDGTMLRVVREMGDSDRPVIGVNIGSLGFMTSVTQESLEAALECLAADRFTASARTVAACAVLRGGCEVASGRALNEAAIGRGPSPRMVTLNVAVNGDRVTSYSCDGLIVSTPTGSTGHSLSAGGPILPPDTKAFVLSVICPHTLSSRPLVVPDDAEITIDVEECGGALGLTLDGQVEIPLQLGDRVRVSRSARPVRLLHLPGYSYFDVLRRKLGWRGSSASRTGKEER